jgi:hypothetical protein
MIALETKIAYIRLIQDVFLGTVNNSVLHMSSGDASDKTIRNQMDNMTTTIRMTPIDLIDRLKSVKDDKLYDIKCNGKTLQAIKSGYEEVYNVVYGAIYHAKATSLEMMKLVTGLKISEVIVVVMVAWNTDNTPDVSEMSHGLINVLECLQLKPMVYTDVIEIGQKRARTEDVVEDKPDRKVQKDDSEEHQADSDDKPDQDNEKKSEPEASCAVSVANNDNHQDDEDVSNNEQAVDA